MAKTKISIFEGKKIRRVWDERREKWYFSVIDVMVVLAEQPDFKKAQSYWTTLKSRLKQEGNKSVTKCDKLKLQSADGKHYKTDVADVETLLRLIQSVPSPKAEPVKLWLARVGYERIEEINDPEKAEGLLKTPDWNWNKKPERRLSAGQIIFRKDEKDWDERSASKWLRQKDGFRVISSSF